MRGGESGRAGRGGEGGAEALPARDAAFGGPIPQGDTGRIAARAR